VVELVMALEEEFGIDVPDDDVENIRTIRDIVEYVSARAAAAA
jgi:acyl carrier protein